MANNFWFKFNFKDWADDVKPLSLTARGLLLELIIHLRKNEGKMPVDIRLMVRLTGGLTEEIQTGLREFRENLIFDFTFEDGKEYLISRKIVKENHKALINKENGLKGGNPKLKNSVNRKGNRTSVSNSNSDSNFNYNSNSFKPPEKNEVAEYMSEINFPGVVQDEAEGFIDFYQGKGWMIGKNKMKDWKATVRTWKKRNNSQSHESGNSKTGKSKHSNLQAVGEGIYRNFNPKPESANGG